ncbi:MAG TPA: OsmC family protein, partial [Halanaerobiales bacterium]|nr:OsmC family protein [Halanaerobiales bacterium]
SIEVEIEGDIDDKAMSSADVYSGFQEVRFKYKIDSDADKDKVEKLYKKIEDFCPVSDTLREKVELKGEYEIK